jgi:hypothetical protein
MNDYGQMLRGLQGAAGAVRPVQAMGRPQMGNMAPTGLSVPPRGLGVAQGVARPFTGMPAQARGVPMGPRRF